MVKIFLVKKILVKKIFGPECVCPKIVTQINLSSQKFLIPKPILGLKKLDANKFGSTKNLDPTKWGSKKIVALEKKC